MGNTAGKYTSLIALSFGAGGTAGTAILTATMKGAGSVNKNIAGKTIQLSTGDGGKIWTCAVGTINTKYVPGACK
jgi:hypothetical protein